MLMVKRRLDAFDSVKMPPPPIGPDAPVQNRMSLSHTGSFGARERAQSRAPPEKPWRPTRHISFSTANTDANQRTWYANSTDFAYFAAQGARPHMEDRMDYVSDERNAAIYCLYDGHGGTFVANILERVFATSLWYRLFQQPEKVPDWNSTFTDEAMKVDQRVLSSPSTAAFDNPVYAGSTLLSAVVYRHRYLVVANIGDCRAVLCDAFGNAKNLTVDHKPHVPAERARIEAAGGFVSFVGVWRVAGTLAVSRVIGDGYLKRQRFVVAQPDVFVVDLAKQRAQFLILASDGLWDVVASQEAVELVLRYRRGTLVSTTNLTGDPWLEAAQQLVSLAIRKGSFDNVSVLIINLSNNTTVSAHSRR